MMGVEKEQPRKENIVLVSIVIESGCDVLKGEYKLSIDDFIGSLDISSKGGVDDISLIKKCIQDYFNSTPTLKKGVIEIKLDESKELKNDQWCKCYEIYQIRSEGFK